MAISSQIARFKKRNISVIICSLANSLIVASGTPKDSLYKHQFLPVTSHTVSERVVVFGMAPDTNRDTNTFYSITQAILILYGCNILTLALLLLYILCVYFIVLFELMSDSDSLFILGVLHPSWGPGRMRWSVSPMGETYRRSLCHRVV